MSLSRKLLAEYLGTTLLLATVVGSGIMGAALSRGNDGLALLANAGATAGALYVLIVNPAVTIARLVTQTFAGIRPGDFLGFAVAQIVGAMAAWVIFNALVSESNSKNDESSIRSDEVAEPFNPALASACSAPSGKATDWSQNA